MTIEKRDINEIQDTTHKIMLKFIDEMISCHNSNEKDILTVQYFDMMFRAGFEMAKLVYKN